MSLLGKTGDGRPENKEWRREAGKTSSRKGANVKNRRQEAGKIGDRRTETGEGKDKTLTGKFQTMSLDVSLL